MLNEQDIQLLRAQFPILNRQVYDRPLIYLDNAASSLKLTAVWQAEEQLARDYYGNIHRGAHFMADKATAEFENTRTSVRNFINAQSDSEIIFTKGSTESINLVAYSFGEAFVSAGDEIVVSEMEHHANIVPWQLMATRKGAAIRVLPFDDSGRLMTEQLDALLTPRTRLIAVAHVSNTLGTVNPIADIISMAHRRNVRVLVDGAQMIAHKPVDVQALDADFYVFSGHKMYGPNGVGILYGKKELLEQMPPYQGGGEMIEQVSFANTTFNRLPYKFEAGTPNISGTIALGEAVKFLMSPQRQAWLAHENTLLTYATKKLSEISGLRIYGQQPEKAGVISFNIDGVHPYDLAVLLDKMGVATRSGRLCADPVMTHFGVTAMLRISFALYNTRSEIDSFIEILRKVREML
ncbi:MAG: cysteine desulfurase [Bacteroidales bacterium]|jgi:cysteine desulfurase/selenocysteine lyase|nr:cysteine desulfurase [Bacteroidales bacterium]